MIIVSCQQRINVFHGFRFVFIYYYFDAHTKTYIYTYIYVIYRVCPKPRAELAKNEAEVFKPHTRLSTFDIQIKNDFVRVCV